jgi:hypothetical protein
MAARSTEREAGETDMGNENAPTVKPNKGARFYNPGDRFNEPINYSLDGIGDIHAIARWIVDAEATSFFNVPTELRLLNDGQRIPVDFPNTVLQRFANRGIVMIDEEWEPSSEDADLEPFARNEKEAKEKGDRGWIRYIQGICKDHINAVHRAQAAGGIPLEAIGFTKRAFKLLNMADPASLAFDNLKLKSEQGGAAPSNSAELSEIRAQLIETQEALAKLMRNLAAEQEVKKQDSIEARAANKNARS